MSHAFPHLRYVAPNSLSFLKGVRWWKLYFVVNEVPTKWSLQFGNVNGFLLATLIYPAMCFRILVLKGCNGIGLIFLLETWYV